MAVRRLLVCGSRGCEDGGRIERRLRELQPAEVISGGARGADSLAAAAARRLGIPVRVFRPDWSRHGSQAGFVRNDAMLDEEPDLVLAFWDGRSTGTNDTIRKAVRRGIVVEIQAA